MDFKPTYQAAIKRKKEFLSLGLREYSNSRNYDYGPNKRHNVSGSTSTNIGNAPNIFTELGVATIV